MADKLKVDELRTELAQRGLNTARTKPTLVRRLESALRKETKSSTNESVGSVCKKRSRGSEDGDSNVPEKVKAVEKLLSMGIHQLREQATVRGVSASGSKKELIERLCEDREKDSEEIIEVFKKRSRGFGDGDSNGTEKVRAVEKLRSMGTCQLREQATVRGVSETGSKKELIERLCEDPKEDSEEILEGKEEVYGSSEEKFVKPTKKGAAVLDQWLSDHIKAQYHVLQLGDEIYDAMLSQANVGENDNKFYAIQALESDDGGTFMVYNRWGRVGVKGQDKLHGPYTSRESAIQEFELKFFSKTKNQWSDRKAFICHPRCYTRLEMDYREVSENPNDSIMKIQHWETQLEPRIAKFISLIFNIGMMKQQMMEIGYNAEKLPLGKLSKGTILKGYDVLKRIADVIGRSDGRKLEQLSGEFYTVIPHDFGFKKMREFVIDTPHKLKRKLEMIEAVGEIEVATKLLKDDIEMQEDPLYSYYRSLHCKLTPVEVDSKEFTMEDPLYSYYQSLHCKLTPVEVDSKEFTMIEKYMKNTHAKTHSNYTVDIVQIFGASREGENERFKKFSNTANRMLLWHGSRLTNWTGILSQGLRIAPPEAPVTGYTFGKGVYFADMFSNSANHCYSTHATRAGVLLLCEVALGDMAELLASNDRADQLPDGKLSTKGVGATEPDPSEFQALEDGVVVPLGKPKEQQGPKGSLLYNEYIVYNVDQIRMRYVIQVNFNFKR